VSTHTLTVFNAVDVPDVVAFQVMALLAPYDPDIYVRDADEKGNAL
jgi:hypothetical protein